MTRKIGGLINESAFIALNYVISQVGWIFFFEMNLYIVGVVFFFFYVEQRVSLVGFGCVLWHINHCRLFNAKSSLYIYIKYIIFGLVGFYGISTIVGYLMPNPLYTYILNIYDLVWLGFMAYQPL